VVCTRRNISNWWNGARGGGRTHNLQLRRLTLYPIELHARRNFHDIVSRGFAQMQSATFNHQNQFSFTGLDFPKSRSKSGGLNHYWRAVI
jgi:hypothetical protein